MVSARPPGCYVFYWPRRTGPPGRILGKNSLTRFRTPGAFAATGLPTGAGHVIVLEETGQSRRCHQILHLRLQPHQTYSLTWIALPFLLPTSAQCAVELHQGQDFVELRLGQVELSREIIG